MKVNDPNQFGYYRCLNKRFFSKIGFGLRSHRYAVILRDMVREQLFVEPGREDNFGSNPYGESSPENVMKAIKGSK